MYAHAKALLVYLAEMSCAVRVELLELLRLEAVLGIAVDISSDMEHILVVWTHTHLHFLTLALRKYIGADTRDTCIGLLCALHSRADEGIQSVLVEVNSMLEHY